MGAVLYLGWLSPLALVALLLLAIPTIVGYRLLQRKAQRFMQQSLHQRDELFTLYRTLIEGVKELALHTLLMGIYLR